MALSLWEPVHNYVSSDLSKVEINKIIAVIDDYIDDVKKLGIYTEV